MSSPILEVGAFTGLTLDDPVLGTLDDNVLDGGIAFTELSDGLYSVSINRGRSRDLQRTNAGSLSVQLKNNTRLYDPLNDVSPFQNLIVPRLPVRLSFGTALAFTGLISDWDFTYTPSGDSVATLKASDSFSAFARNINIGTALPEELTGQRLNRILDQDTVRWPAGDRDIEDGNSTLAAGTATDNALNYMSSVIETSEQGLLFMTKDGNVAFRERLTPIDSTLTFSDDGTGIPYEDVKITYGTDTMVNDARVTFPGGTAIAEDATSKVTYGIVEKTIATQLSNLAQAQGIADFLIARYGRPELRIESITVPLSGLTPAQVTAVLAIELGERSNIVFTPNKIGEPMGFINRVIGISHKVQPRDHRVTFNFEQLLFQFFTLDSDSFGRLDGDALLGF
jgi:hypothetical protein